jgi:hypothetical protein
MLLTDQKKQGRQPNELIDVMSEGTVHLCEVKSKNGRIRVEGEFGRWDRATANKRLYPKGLWESNINRLTPAMAGKKVIGELDHPDDGKTSLKRASHVITKLWLADDGRVMGEAEIVPTRLGKDLEALFRAGVPIGISSRGYGSTKQNQKGEDVVQSDYRLVTFDFVAEPADGDAYPEVFFEGVEIPMADELTKKFVQKMEQGSPSITPEALRKEFEATLLSRVADLKEGLRAEIRKELMADPDVGSARQTLEAIVALVGKEALAPDVSKIVQDKDDEIAALKRDLQEKDLQIETANEQIEHLAMAAKAAGYRFHLENLLRNEEDADLIRSAIGEVTEFESTGALTERVEHMRTEIETQREEDRRAYAKAHAAEMELQKKNRKLADGLEEALGTNKALALQLYAERQVRNHPQSNKILGILESTEIKNKKQIDDLIEQFREVEDEESFDAIRDRVRNMVGGGRSYVAEDEDKPRRVQRDYQGLGAPLHELRKLSGIHRS